LAQEKPLEKFSELIATTNLRNILDPITQVLENVLDFKPQLEVVVSSDHAIVFREDLTYYTETESGQVLPYNPFISSDAPAGDVRCMERPALLYSQEHLNRMFAKSAFDYVYMANPKLYHLMADAINVWLNEDQLWVKQYRAPREHFLQQYIHLDRLVEVLAPEVTEDLRQLQTEIGSEQTSFRLQLANESMTRAEALARYDARASKYENTITQDFWERSEVQYALRVLTMKLYRVVTALFPTARREAERSMHPAYGYDVFYASVAGDRELVIKQLGDYRILRWELGQ
jgi:hypothetical protein